MTDLHNSGIGEFLVILAVIVVCWLSEKVRLLREDRSYKNNTTDIISNTGSKRIISNTGERLGIKWIRKIFVILKKKM